MDKPGKSRLLAAASLTVLLGGAGAIAGTPRVYQGKPATNVHFKNVVKPGKELKTSPIDAAAAKKAMAKFLADKKRNAPKRDLDNVLAGARDDEARAQMKAELDERQKSKQAFVAAETSAVAKDKAAADRLAKGKQKAEQIRACKKAGGATCK